MKTLAIEPLTKDAFAPFGDVIETAGRDAHWINEQTCRRFDDLAHFINAIVGRRVHLLHIDIAGFRDGDAGIAHAAGMDGGDLRAGQVSGASRQRYRAE